MRTVLSLAVAFSLAIAAAAQTTAKPDNSTTMQFEKPTYTVRNESGSASISVIRKGGASGQATVSYSTKGGDGRPGIDYTAASDKLVFADGETRKTFTIPVLKSASTGNATVALQLSDPVNAALGSPAQATLTIESTGSAGAPNPVASRVMKHVALTVATLAVLLFIVWLAVLQAKHRSKEWAADFLPKDEPGPVFPGGSSIDPPFQARLQNQFKEVMKRLEHHVNVMVFFYAAYYSSIVGLSVAGAIAAVMAILVSKGGWQSADEYVANLFFTTTLVAAFFGSSPAVFEQEKNITDNKVFAMKYLALKNEILTFAVTNEGLRYDIQNPLPLNPGQPTVQDQKPKMGVDITTNEFLHYIDLQLSRDNVAIGFDVKQVADYKGALEMK